jgi:hypothetical protein
MRDCRLGRESVKSFHDAKIRDAYISNLSKSVECWQKSSGINGKAPPS